jgi:hypothetical protein
MTVPVPKVEIGFDLTETGRGPFFKLDDPIKGKLDNTEWLLGGTLFFDVTEDVVSVTVRRGKNHALDQYDSGLANVVFNNNQRTFDPEFEASPYYTQIIPKRQIRISSGDQLQFFGRVDDWNLNYEPSGVSLASASCSDPLALFATASIQERTNDVEQSGERINTVLSLPEVDWPVSDRDIQTGAMELGADTIPQDTNALEYLRLVTRSEPGSFFISKSGTPTFRDRRTAPTSGGLVFADDGSGIPYANLLVEYGSELLYNQVLVDSVITDTTLVANALESQGTYGIFSLSRNGLLVNSNESLAEYAAFLASQFSEPEYRFKAVDINVHQRSPEQQAQILGLELGDVIEMKFTPNGIAPAIVKFAEVISIDHNIDTVSHVTTLGFSTLDFALLVLDDTEFGKLDSGNALAF